MHSFKHTCTACPDFRIPAHNIGTLTVLYSTRCMVLYSMSQRDTPYNVCLHACPRATTYTSTAHVHSMFECRVDCNHNTSLWMIKCADETLTSADDIFTRTICLVHPMQKFNVLLNTYKSTYLWSSGLDDQCGTTPCECSWQSCTPRGLRQPWTQLNESNNLQATHALRTTTVHVYRWCGLLIHTWWRVTSCALNHNMIANTTKHIRKCGKHTMLRLFLYSS